MCDSEALKTGSAKVQTSAWLGRGELLDWVTNLFVDRSHRCFTGEEALSDCILERLLYFCPRFNQKIVNKTQLK